MPLTSCEKCIYHYPSVAPDVKRTCQRHPGGAVLTWQWSCGDGEPKDAPLPPTIPLDHVPMTVKEN
jgi:hypothetical protein